MKIFISTVLYILCLGALIVFVAMPENKYEWMLQDDPTIVEKSELPVDQNAGVRQAVFFVPVMLFAFITLFTSRKIHSKRWFTITSVFCFIVMLVAIAKMVI
jgi:hypothetical protein